MTAQQILILYTLSSYPHFIASYGIAYSKKEFKKNNKFALFLFPVVVLVLVAITYWFFSSLELIIQILVVLLIWHYVKQSYGVTIWSSVSEKVSLSYKTKQQILAAYLFIGAAAIVFIHNTSSNFLYLGQYIQLADLDPLVSEIFTYLAASSIFFLLFKIKRETNISFKSNLRLNLPLISTFVWFLAIRVSQVAIVLLPLVHALQYSPFVYRATSSILRSKIRLFGYFVGYVIIGFLALHQLPKFLATSIDGETGGVLFSTVLIVINLHHYALDSVIWKMSRKECRELLRLN